MFIIKTYQTQWKNRGFEKGTKVPEKMLPNRWFFEGSPVREGVVKPYKNQGFRMIFMHRPPESFREEETYMQNSDWSTMQCE